MEEEEKGLRFAVTGKRNLPLKGRSMVVGFMVEVQICIFRGSSYSAVSCCTVRSGVQELVRPLKRGTEILGVWC